MSENESPVLLEIKDRLSTREMQAKLAGALAKAQGEFKPVAKNRAVQIRMKEGGTYRFEYADLEQLISCTRLALSANGLALVQRVDKDVLVTELLHAGGGTLHSSSDLPRMGQDPKAYGAAISYLRRYAYSALLCLAADDDLDEDGQEGGKPEQRGAEEKPRQEPKPRADKADGPKLANGAQLKWVKDRLALLDPEAGAKILAAHGIKALDTELTAAAFDALKTELLK